MSREAMKQALESLEWFVSAEPGDEPPINQTITALKQALAEPEHQAKPITGAEMSAWVKDTWEKCQADAWQEQEPVAWMGTDIEGNPNKFRLNYFGGGIPLYTAPTPRKPLKLTDEEIDRLYVESETPVAFGRAIEKAHGIGEQK